MKHEYKTLKQYKSGVFSECEVCGLKRQRVVEGVYLYGKFPNQTKDEPDCKPEEVTVEPGVIRFCFECGDQLDKEELYCTYCRLQS